MTIVVILLVILIGSLTKVSSTVAKNSIDSRKVLNSASAKGTKYARNRIVVASKKKPLSQLPKKARTDAAATISQIQQWCAMCTTFSDLTGDTSYAHLESGNLPLTLNIGSSYYQAAQSETTSTMAGANTKETLEKERDRRYLFAMDVVRCLRLCADSRTGQITADKLKSLETIYGGREKLLEAKSIMENWKNSDDLVVAKLSGDLQQGLDNWIYAGDLYAKVFDEMAEYPESDVALGSAKLRSGRHAVFESSFGIIYVISSERPYNTDRRPVQFQLSNKQVRGIINLIEANFHKEIKECKYNEAQKSLGRVNDYPMADEVWAALLIRDYIQRAM